MILNKKIVLVLIPVLCIGALVGCSNKDLDNSNPQQQEQVQEAKIKYSDDFKTNFMEISNQFNEMEDFKESFKLMEWNDKANKPILPDNIVVTKLTKDEIDIKVTTKLSDEEIEITNLINQMTKVSEKISDVMAENENYEETDEWKEYEALSGKYDEAVSNYSKSLNEEDSDNKEKKDNSTVLTKSLIYGVMGGGEDAVNILNENFSMLRLVVELTGLQNDTNEDYIDYLLDNIYMAVDEETVYGKLSYDREMNIDKKETIQTFSFKKYSKSMDKEIEEYKEKISEYEKEFETEKE